MEIAPTFLCRPYPGGAHCALTRTERPRQARIPRSKGLWWLRHQTSLSAAPTPQLMGNSSGRSIFFFNTPGMRSSPPSQRVYFSLLHGATQMQRWWSTWERTPNLDPGSGPNHRHHLNFPWWKVDPECLRTGGLQDPRLRAQVQLLRMLIPKVRAQDTVCAQGASCSPQIGSAGSQGRGGGAVCAPRSSLLPGLITCVDQSSG